MDHLRGSSPTKTSPPGNESPEQLLDVFRAAALSVTKLYKTSAAAQNKARTDGYQDCLEDLLVFLDKHDIGLSDGEGWRIRRWATERFDREGVTQSIESEDEADKNETVSSPEIHRSDGTPLSTVTQPEPEMRTDSAPPAPVPEPAPIQSAAEAASTAPPQPIVVPTQDNFTFQSSMAYPQDTDLSMANLDLSDSRTNQNLPHRHTSHSFRPRGTKSVPRARASHLGRGAGQKRKINIAEIFDLGSIGGKDIFGGGNGGGKRSRHT
ncbi:hypothetical protein JX265_006957 [Neoarthrinium moseri]|uniref:Uncharacterized protein n=1 Tax=Neoarthrinium moseri TaxID=1658444 RepID=A0A9P9WLC1_9PEZI|nr:uncharacterized protein JN550_002568 [Neoarthrinium moseri]KAI1868978.1 hypothetical protein JX265_006957 [Neoarthrinium moseri]KAI1873989.1 hypothetical protein JN550_002568 [Neoarthrinium moseri]